MSQEPEPNILFWRGTIKLFKFNKTLFNVGFWLRGKNDPVETILAYNMRDGLKNKHKICA